MKIGAVFAFILLIFFGCNKTNVPINGNWTIWDVYYKNEDISGVDKSTAFYIASSMTIEPKRIIFSLKHDEHKLAKYNLENKGDTIYMVIYDSEDARLNGKYELLFRQIKSENRGRYKEYEMELINNVAYILATKSETSGHIP